MANTLKNNTASNAIAKMYLNADLADVHFEFSVDDDVEKIPANKAVLAAVSPVFYTMFFGSLKEGSVVKITDADVDSFKEFLQFFYLGEFTLTTGKIETVVRLADKYNVLDAVMACATFVQTQLTIDNVCWGYQLATFLQSEELIEFCKSKIAESPKEVFASDGFKRCDKSVLKRILELEDLNCKEINVLEACLSWAKYACKQNGSDETQGLNLRSQLGDCLPLIRFGAMTMEEFSTIAKRNIGLFTQDELMDVVFTLTTKDHTPKTFNANRRRFMPSAWNENEVLLCKRVRSNESGRTFKGKEVVEFTSNQMVKLEAFETAATFDKSYIDLLGAGVKVTVSKIGHSKEVLSDGHSNTWNGDRLKVVFPHPILIEANALYEIQLSLSNGLYPAYYKATWKPTVELGNGHTVEFYANNLAGWIESLFFNKV